MSRGLALQVVILFGAVLALSLAMIRLGPGSHGARTPKATSAPSGPGGRSALTLETPTPQGRAPDSTPAPGGTPQGHPSLPINAAQKQRAVQIALGDTSVQKLLDGRAYSVKKVLPISDKDSVVGGLVVIAFPEHQTITGTWFGQSLPCDQLALPPEKRTVAPRKVSWVATWADLSTIWVLTDFKSGRVIELLPTSEPGESGYMVGKEVLLPGVTPAPKCED